MLKLSTSIHWAKKQATHDFYLQRKENVAPVRIIVADGIRLAEPKIVEVKK